MSSIFVTGALVAVVIGASVMDIVGILDGTLDGISLLGSTATGVLVGSKMLMDGMLTISGIGANVNPVGAGTATGNATGLLVTGIDDRGDGIGDGIGACGCT